MYETYKKEKRSVVSYHTFTYRHCKKERKANEESILEKPFWLIGKDSQQRRNTKKKYQGRNKYEHEKLINGTES